MENGEDPELEEIRRRKMLALQSAQQKAYQDEIAEREAEIDAQRRAILRKILTPEARERLANLRLARPEIAEGVEQQLILLAQSGRLREMITDEMLKQILEQIIPQKREIKIIRR